MTYISEGSADIEHVHMQTTTPIIDRFPQLAVLFHWKNAKEELCSVLISWSDIWDDLAHSSNVRNSLVKGELDPVHTLHYSAL